MTKVATTLEDRFRRSCSPTPAGLLLFAAVLTSMLSTASEAVTMLAPPPPQSLSSSSMMSGGFGHGGVGGGGGGEKQRKSIRCYICGGETGLECKDIPEPGWKSPYVRPEPLSAKDGRSPVIRTCDGVISNKGCIKQVVNDGE